MLDTGMRIGETISLTRGDVDLESGVITLRHAKFDRTRLASRPTSIPSSKRFSYPRQVDADFRLPAPA